MEITRRKFFATGALAAGAVATAAAEEHTSEYHPPQHPVIITRETHDNSINEAYAMLQNGADTLDAAIHICAAREDDPTDHSVGYGGLPNEDGVVELDACVMHGPTRRIGAIGAVTNIRHAAQLARTVMERTYHVMLVGEGAGRFAIAEGFQKENLLTDDARKMWLLWKEHGTGWWGPGIDSPNWKPPAVTPTPNGIPKAALHLPRHPAPQDMPQIAAHAKNLYALADRMGIPPSLRRQAVQQILWPTTGTIHVSTLNAKGEMSGATTTSGMAWKIPGRVGDSAIIGAGCFTDQNIGSAGATGNGEENIKVAGAHAIVEKMREGATPKEAGMEALRRIAANYNHDMTRLRYLDMIYYILRRDGAYAGVSLWSTRETGERKVFVVHDGTQRTELCDYLFEGTTLSIHPF